MMNDPRNLAVVTIVILQPNQLGDRLKGLRDYAEGILRVRQARAIAVCAAAVGEDAAA